MAEQIMTEEYKEYLDDLRESGKTNMLAAPSYLQEEFGLNKADARKIFLEWMDSFNEVAPPLNHPFRERYDRGE